jgi:hypothetical protein
MEALLVILFVLGCMLFGLGLAFLRLTWTTLQVHRQAMHALHQHYAAQRVPRAPLGHIPPQDGRQ